MGFCFMVLESTERDLCMQRWKNKLFCLWRLAPLFACILVLGVLNQIFRAYRIPVSLFLIELLIPSDNRNPPSNWTCR